MTELERFFSHVHKTESCWLWLGATIKRGGYGQFHTHRKDFRKAYYAHRFAYEQMRGAIPKDKVCDHLCRNPLCVNPDHIELVTQRENVRRGLSHVAYQMQQTHCKAGHPLSGPNLAMRRNKRHCRICDRERLRQYYQRRKKEN